jgi:integrase/recombinase XerD
MSRKIKRTSTSALSIKVAFEEFVVAQTAKGFAVSTIQNYHSHFHSISKHIDIETPFCELGQTDIEGMIVSMRESGLATNSSSSYIRVFKTFMNWSQQQGYTSLTVPNYKQVETAKDPYTDEELRLLLEKPKADCNFCEYRNWVIINFLLNSGCRAATVRNIKNCDVDFSNSRIVFRHTKTHKVQVVPLCSQMVRILRDYCKTRGGGDSDYLFCDEYGEMLSPNALRLAIQRYNRSRGVEKTSLHLFRHTFARKYLIDCGGDAFMLQKLLGHSTLKMTRHYCNIYDADLARNFDRLSPLAIMSQQKQKIQMGS